MTLIPVTARPEGPPPFEPKTLAAGAGVFLAAGGSGREDKRIGVHYYKPERFTRESPILLVLPGTGRNANTYRNFWMDAAEAYNVLIATLEYPEVDYDFGAYHMGGVIKNFRLRNVTRRPDGALPTSLYIRDEDIEFEFNERRETWLFHDFDRIFGILATATDSARRKYDLFGHSAGGQILHRLALFQPNTRADRIIAANSGFYTLPRLDVPLPFGLKDTGITKASLAASLALNLTLLLGGEDDDPDKGGRHLHTPLADQQGLGRLSRGRYFFEAGMRQARELAISCNWKLEVVPGVGHDGEAMGRAAARYLYS